MENFAHSDDEFLVVQDGRIIHLQNLLIPFGKYRSRLFTNSFHELIFLLKLSKIYWVSELAWAEQRSVGEPEPNNYYYYFFFPNHLYLELVGERKHREQSGKDAIQIKDKDSKPRSEKYRTKTRHKAGWFKDLLEETVRQSPNLTQITSWPLQRPITSSLHHQWH